MNKLLINEMPTMSYLTEEALNRLRVNLNFLGNDVRRIMIISSTENEGKSFVAFHIWRQMAQSGVDSILIDADLRKSVMTKKYHMEAVDGKEFFGTSHALAKDMALKDALPNVENLINPTMLFEGKAFQRLLDEAAEAYRFVFVDVPPLDLVSDGEKIGSMCDGAILVVRSGRVSKSIFQNTVNQLERSGCPLLGVVLNGVEDQRKQKYYQTYGYYEKRSKK